MGKYSVVSTEYIKVRINLSLTKGGWWLELQWESMEGSIGSFHSDNEQSPSWLEASLKWREFIVAKSTPPLLRSSLPNRKLPMRGVNGSFIFGFIFRMFWFSQTKEDQKRFLSADPFSDLQL